MFKVLCQFFLFFPRTENMPLWVPRFYFEKIGFVKVDGQKMISASKHCTTLLKFTQTTPFNFSKKLLTGIKSRTNTNIVKDKDKTSTLDVGFSGQCPEQVCQLQRKGARRTNQKWECCIKTKLERNGKVEKQFRLLARQFWLQLFVFKIWMQFF